MNHPHEYCHDMYLNTSTEIFVDSRRVLVASPICANLLRSLSAISFEVYSHTHSTLKKRKEKKKKTVFS